MGGLVRTLMGTTKIPLYVSNGKAYAWTVQDVSTLRAQHRICGILTGTLPHLTQQNFFLGLPLLLMPEEVVLLLEKGFCTLVDDTHSLREPTPAELGEWNEDRRKDIQTQIEQWREKEKNSIGTRADIFPDGKRSEEATAKRRERQAKQKSAAASETPLSTPSIMASSTTPSFTITIPSTSTSLAWYQPRRYNDLTSAREAGIWMYPQTPHERASCRIFRDLWEKGYYIGSGIKFGGEYLVYPGDPLRYHSHFVASVFSSPDALIRPMEIVAHGRLATGTKKTQLLCAWREEDDTAIYYSVDWAGFG